MQVTPGSFMDIQAKRATSTTRNNTREAPHSCALRRMGHSMLRAGALAADGEDCQQWPKIRDRSADGALPSFAGASLRLRLACASPRRGFRPRGRPTFFAGAKKGSKESTSNATPPARRVRIARCARAGGDSMLSQRIARQSTTFHRHESAARVTLDHQPSACHPLLRMGAAGGPA
mgnify:CR=1 FL=1